MNIVAKGLLLGLMCIVGVAGCDVADPPDIQSIKAAVDYRLDVENRHVLEITRGGGCEAADSSGRLYSCPLHVAFYHQRELEKWIKVETSGAFPVTVLEGDFTFQRPSDGQSWEVTDDFHYEREAAKHAVTMRDDVAVDRRGLEQRVQEFVANDRRDDSWRLLSLFLIVIVALAVAIGAWDKQSQRLKKVQTSGLTHRPNHTPDNPIAEPGILSTTTPTGIGEGDATATTFPAMASIHGKWQNRLILGVGVVVFGSLVIPLIGVPFAFVFGDDHWDISYAKSPLAAISFLIAYFGVFAGIIAALVKYVAREQQLGHDALLVDALGIHFLLEGRVIRQISYADMLSSPESGTGDVTMESKSYSTGRGGRATQYFLSLYSRSPSGETQRHLLDFHGKRRGYGYVSNRHELIATFLRGVSRFRPDLRIGHSVFSHYYIDPVTGHYDRKSRIRTEVLGVGFALFVIAAIFTWFSYSGR